MKFDLQKTVFLIDGSSFLYRAYYGLRPLHTSKGVPVHAVYSFCRMIKKIIDECNPQYMALVWDSKGKTTRHEFFTEYKATRQAAPSDLFIQKELIQEFADLVGIAQIAQPGIEADDIMYSLAKEQIARGGQALFLTSDKDMGQAISENVYLYDTFREIFYDRAAFEKRLGFPIEKMPFYYALLGDTSDNIPGVKGIGKKGAEDLVCQFDSLEQLYENVNLVKSAKSKNALLAHKDDAFLSRDLFLLQYHKTGLTTKDLIFESSGWSNARPLFEKLEFTSLLKNLGITPVDPEKMMHDKTGYWKQFEFKTVTTAQELERLCALLQSAKEFALDTETDGLDALQSNLVGLSFCVQGESFYVPCAHETEEQQLKLSQVLDALKPILQDRSKPKILHHAKFDSHVLWHHGVDLQGISFDTYIAAQMIAQDWQQAGLKQISQFYLSEDMLTFEEVVTKNKYKNFSQVPLDLATLYAAADAFQTSKLAPILKKELADRALENVYYEIEHPLIQVIIDMERRGISCDKNSLEQLGKSVTQKLDEIKAKIDAYDVINLNSPQQVAQLLFEKLQLPVQKKSSKGKASTDQEVLQELRKFHPIAGLIIDYRELTKLKGTYIDALPTYINPQTNKIHTNFWQVKTATGRLSSSDPNLQNIPADSSGLGQEIRAAFLPDKGCKFLSVDYSQIELRVLAHLSKDANLIHAFTSGYDIHAQTASRLFDVPLGQVSHEQRQLGKRINFSILYGLTPYGLSKDLDISFSDAKKYIEKYFEQYPGVSAWMENVIEFAKGHGYVKTYWGRVRYVPLIHEKNKNLYEQGRRIAINTVAQGTAADLVKLGMILVDTVCKEESLPAALILQIHDELLLSVHEESVSLVQARIKELLETIVQWDVPLVATTRVGDNWKEVSK